jgi:hypothetical protein
VYGSGRVICLVGFELCSSRIQANALFFQLSCLVGIKTYHFSVKLFKDIASFERNNDMQVIIVLSAR